MNLMLRLKRLLNCFQQSKKQSHTRMEVPIKVDNKEYIGRIILHQFHYSESKKRLLPDAFMPSPREEDEVSTLRFKYTDADFCKKHGLSVADVRKRKFIGIAFLLAEEIIEAPKSDNFSATPIGTPLCINHKLREDSPVYSNDEGIPSHADIKYNVKIVPHSPVKAEFKQKVLKPLVLAVGKRFYKDPKLDSEKWEGDEILLQA